MWQVFKGLFSSKKFVAAMVGIIVSVALYLFPDLPEEAITEVVTIVVGYLLAQGLADWGKEAQKVKKQ